MLPLGHCVLLHVADVSTVPLKFAFEKFVLLKFVLLKLACVKFAPVKVALVISLPTRFTPVSVALVRSTWAKVLSPR